MGTDDVASNAYLEHQRALNRERQKRYQQRKRTARDNGLSRYMLDDNGRPNRSVQRVAENILQGMGQREALRAAGSSEKAVALLDKAKHGLATIAKAKGITVERLMENIVRRDQATALMLTAEGSIERPDWTAQGSAARDMVAVLDRAGELPAASQSHGGTQITVNIVRFNSTPQDVVNNAIEAKSFTSETDVSNEKD